MHRLRHEDASRTRIPRRERRSRGQHSACLGHREALHEPGPASEGPGHLSCMLYSVALCPYLSSPGARRKLGTTIGDEEIPRGDRRGTEAAVVGFESYEWHVGANGFEIYFDQPVEMLTYAQGADLIGELAAEIAHEPQLTQQCPPYLLDDDTKAEKAAKSMLATGTNSPPTIARREERARKKQRKSARTARRKRR